jgi:hypothetical protein
MHNVHTFKSLAKVIGSIVIGLGAIFVFTGLVLALAPYSLVATLTTNGAALGDMIADPIRPLAYVADSTNNSIRIVNLDTNAFSGTQIAVGNHPTALDILDDNLYALNQTGQSVSVVDLAAHTVVDTIPLGFTPQDVAAGQGDLLYVSELGWGDLRVINRVTHTPVNTVTTPGPRLKLLLTANRQILYAGTLDTSPSHLWRYDVSDATNLITPTAQITVGNNLRDMTLSADEGLLFVAAGYPEYVQIFNAATLSAAGQMNTGAYPNAVAAFPNGQGVLAAHTMAHVDVYSTTGSVLLSNISTQNVVVNGGLLAPPNCKKFVAQSEGGVIQIFQQIDDFFVYLPVVYNNFTPTRCVDDNFSDPASGWPTGNTGYHQYGYGAGNYFIRNKTTDTWTGVSASHYYHGSAIIEVDAHHSPGSPGWYGIVFGLNPSWSEFYLFEVNPGQRTYGLWKYQGGWSTLAGGTSSAINTGSGLNSLKVTHNVNQIDLYVNNTYLGTVSDSSFSGYRRLGLSATSTGQANQTAYFDNYGLTTNDCATVNGTAVNGLEVPALPARSLDSSGRPGGKSLLQRNPDFLEAK